MTEKRQFKERIKAAEQALFNAYGAGAVMNTFVNDDHLRAYVTTILNAGWKDRKTINVVFQGNDDNPIVSEKCNFPAPGNQWPAIAEEHWPIMNDEARNVRGQIGWAPSDIWSFDHYIAGVIAGSIRRIAEFPGYKGESQEEWHATLNKMAKGFEAYNAPDAFHSEKAYKRVRKSLKLFRKHFGGLWT